MSKKNETWREKKERESNWPESGKPVPGKKRLPRSWGEFKVDLLQWWQDITGYTKRGKK